MKTKFNQTTKHEEITYPCLMITNLGVNDNIYLMTAPKCGMRVHSARKKLIGKYSTTLAMDSLDPYHGTVTLEN